MAGQPVPGVAEIRMTYVQENQNVENVYHVARDSGTWSKAELTTLADGFIGWESATAKALRASTVQLIEVVATDLTSLGGYRIVEPVTPPVQGTHDGEPLPSNVTVAVHADIGIRGHGVSGRVFWIGLTATMCSGDSIDPVPATAVESALVDLITMVAGLDASWHLSTVHRQIGGVRPPTGTYTHIRDFNFSDFTLDSQKLRLPGHKKHRKKRPTP